MRTGQRVASAWINSPQAAEVAKYYTQGHSVKETAEKFGVSTGQVNNLAKKRGLTNGMTWLGRNSSIERRAKEAEQRLAKTLAHLGFDYLGGYKTSESKCRIRCRDCGSEYEQTYDWLRKGNVMCAECKRQETIRKNREAVRAKEAKTIADALTDEIYRLWYPKIDKRREALLSQTGVCEICGKHYSVRDYINSCGMKYARNNGVCSEQCRDERKRRIIRESHKGRQDSHRHRAKKYGCDYDPGVTLKKLVARDGLECKICGQMCDWNDHSWSKYSGPLYPSIDHIVPMSKGGGHVWENVQVAHIMCNSEKGNRLEVTDT